MIIIMGLLSVFLFFSILNNRTFAFIKVSRRRHNIVLFVGGFGGGCFSAGRLGIDHGAVIDRREARYVHGVKDQIGYFKIIMAGPDR